MSDTPPEGPEGFQVHYVKSNFFRVIYSEGCYGGITPRGMIQFSFYNERPPIPTLADIKIGGDGVAHEAISERREGFVREVEASVMMTPEAATSLRDWLSTKIDEFAVLKAALGA